MLRRVVRQTCQGTGFGIALPSILTQESLGLGSPPGRVFNAIQDYLEKLG